MLFFLPLLPAFAAATVSIGEAIGIVAAVKGAADYHKARPIQENVNAEYQETVRRIEQKSKEVQKRFESFGLLKLQTYSGIIREAADCLSGFINVGLTSFKDIQVEQIKIFSNELVGLKNSVVKASDVLSCLSAGVKSAVHERFPYKDTSPFQRAG